MLAYGIYFVADARSPDFRYAHNAQIPVEAFEALDSFSVDDFIAPWRYRILPRLLQWWLYRAARVSFHIPFLWVALALSCVFMALALAGFYVLLRRLRVSTWWALAGAVFAGSSFPVVFGYRVRNWMSLDDALAYALVVAGLLVLLFGRPPRRYGWFVVVSVLGALTRETTLLLAVTVLFDRRLKLPKRLALAAPSLAAFLGIRLLLFQTSEVTTGAGLPVLRLGLNLVEEGVVLTTAYAFAVFGAGWLLGAFGWAHFYGRRAQLEEPLRILWITTPVTVGMLGGFNLLIGSIRENRIWFLVFPWVIGLGVLYLHRRWRALANRRNALWFAGLAALLVAPLVGFLLWVPGGQGLRLASLTRSAALDALYQFVWLPFRYRFGYVPGQLQHVLLHVALTFVVLLWHVAGRCSRSASLRRAASVDA